MSCSRTTIRLRLWSNTCLQLVEAKRVRYITKDKYLAGIENENPLLEILDNGCVSAQDGSLIDMVVVDTPGHIAGIGGECC